MIMSPIIQGRRGSLDDRYERSHSQAESNWRFLYTRRKYIVNSVVLGLWFRTKENKKENKQEKEKDIKRFVYSKM